MVTISQAASRMSNPAAASTMQVYAIAIILAIFSLLFLLLILPPMFWHFRNRNIGATVLVGWVTILLLFTFVNAILWPSDDISTWYNGSGLCDVEVKIQVASQVALPASFACIMRALAAVMDTDRAALTQTKAQRRRTYIVDLSWCIGLPLLQMVLHYIVQTRRYYIYGISGCVPAVSLSWVAVLLLSVPSAIWVLIDAYFAVLILIRLYRYRLTFNAILASSNTTKSRFMRLYLICILWVLGAVPTEGYIMYFNIAVLAKEPYSWASTHNPENWEQIVMIPSGGKVVYDRWVWLVTGAVVFVFFGLGREALMMYRTGLLSLGIGRVFPGLREEHRGSITATISSFNSKARLLFKRKTSNSTWTSDTNASHTTSDSDTTSPKKMAFLDAIDEGSVADEKRTARLEDIEKATQNTARPTSLNRAISIFRPKKTLPAAVNDPLPLTDLSGEKATVQSAVTSGPISPSLVQHVRDISTDELVVRKEVRQGSEHAEPMQSSGISSR